MNQCKTALLQNKRKRDMLYHLLVHLHPERKVSMIDRISSTLELDLQSLRVVWHKEVTRLLHVLRVVMSSQVVSSVNKRVIS